jgi:hypothetical protein
LTPIKVFRSLTGVNAAAHRPFRVTFALGKFAAPSRFGRNA